MTAWQFLQDDVVCPLTGARNMAVDQALLESVQDTGVPVLRLYRWQTACLSFGRNQPARGVYDAAVAARLGIEIVRRPTGGLAVLHDAELTYAVVAPAQTLGGPRASYHTINRALVTGLQRLGVPAQLSGGMRASAFGTVHPCFAEPAAGEVIAHGRKLVGSAQRCERHTLLQHGSILLAGSQDAVARIAAVPFDVSGQATSLAEVLGGVPQVGEIAMALAAGFEEVCGISLAPTGLSRNELNRAAELEHVYRSAEWTWRR